MVDATMRPNRCQPAEPSTQRSATGLCMSDPAPSNLYESRDEMPQIHRGVKRDNHQRKSSRLSSRRMTICSSHSRAINLRFG